jgi:hypothetical protein
MVVCNFFAFTRDCQSTASNRPGSMNGPIRTTLDHPTGLQLRMFVSSRV